jgi:putative CocE/NonD family hydrolase
MKVFSIASCLAAATLLLLVNTGGQTGELASAREHPAARAKRPEPGYEVQIERNVMVRMRDGVSLATDVYYPMRAGQRVDDKLPAVLQRTPYNKLGVENVATFFARHGYLSVVQDCRGRFESEGDFFPFVNEPKDGYDTIAWLAKHPACNGKVGMCGCSYLGWVQLQAATQRPPGLVTIIPFEGPNNGYHYSMHVGGALQLGLLRWTVGMAASSKEARKDPALAKAAQSMLAHENFLRWAARIPWQRGQTPLSAIPLYEDAAFKLWFENTDYNAFWRQAGLGMDEYFDSFADMPILWVGGWYDWYPRSICDGYEKMVQRKRKNQYLLVGPWLHNKFDAFCGDVNFASDRGGIGSHDDFLHLELQWFNRWLKDDAGAEIGKPVSVFVMGGGDGKRQDERLNHGGRWHYGDSWPPRDVQPTAYYLHAKGGLRPSKVGDVGDVAAAAQSSTSYTYDPRDTVSSNGRCFVPFGPADRMSPRDQIELETLPGHGQPGMPIASRPDVLVFQTDPLEKDVTIAGNIQAVLHISSDAPDTDFFVKLIDVHPPSAAYTTGFAVPIADGVLRARYRESFAQPRLLNAGEVYRLEIALEPSANRFKERHRIRIAVCSSNFPAYDINRNTGDPNDRRWRIANNTVWHDTKRPSCIVLPIWASASK